MRMFPLRSQSEGTQCSATIISHTAASLATRLSIEISTWVIIQEFGKVSALAPFLRKDTVESTFQKVLRDGAHDNSYS